MFLAVIPLLDLRLAHDIIVRDLLNLPGRFSLIIPVLLTKHDALSLRKRKLDERTLNTCTPGVTAKTDALFRCEMFSRIHRKSGVALHPK